MPATAGSTRTSGSSAAEDGKVVKSNDASFPGTKPYTLKFDKLVIACGAYSRTFHIVRSLRRFPRSPPTYLCLDSPG